MLMIRPQTIDDEALVETNLVESVGDWDSSVIYALGDRVKRNLIQNGSFTANTNGWSQGNGATLSSVAGRLRVTADGSGQYGADAVQAATTEVGKQYRLIAKAFAGTVPDTDIRVGTSSGGTQYGIASNSDADVLFTATSTTTYVTLLINTSGHPSAYVEFDDVRLVEAGGAADDRIYESVNGGTSHAVTMTIAAPCVVSWAGHGLAASSPILFQTTGALPTGLTAGTVYYVVAIDANTFNVSTTPGGSAINTTGSQSGTHTAIANPNKNRNPAIDDGSNWIDVGPTNRWAMFDNFNGTPTTDPTEIDVTIQASGRIDSLALLNLENAVSAQVVVSTEADGTLFDETFELNSTEGISSWYSYFFEEIERSNKLLVNGLPVYANPNVRVVITGTGTLDVSCGTLVVGMSKDLGETQHDGAQVGIIDYSRKDADDFGNYTIVERPFSDRGSFKTRIAKSQVDGVKKVLADHRATPVVYSASADYNSTLIFGFFREFQIEIDYPLESLVSIDIEGLT